MQCPDGDFACGQICVPMSWRCDGRIDCESKVDEQNCNKTKTALTCDSTQVGGDEGPYQLKNHRLL